MDVSPQTRELREALAAAGVGYDAEDEETEYDDGYFVHSESTLIETAAGDVACAVLAWTRDPDGDKRYDSACGRFGYLELQTDSGGEAASVEEVMAMATCGGGGE